MQKQGKLTEGHCKALLSIIDPEKQYMTAVDMIERGSTVREIEQRNKKINQKQVSKEELKRVTYFIQRYRKYFSRIFWNKSKTKSGKEEKERLL